ncbi:MAG: PQQ-dependent sugar dehydrogenase [Saprospiraceae bacterium]|nr:PQQ-dependent sugar dehydrogenase [Saprospiraceae bacterium]
MVLVPNLSGLTQNADTAWIKDFIRNPRKVIDKNDPRASEIFAKYNTYMPSFGMLSNMELDQTIAYLHTFKKIPETITPDSKLTLIEDPIKDKIPPSKVVCDLQLLTQLPPSAKDLPLARINKLDCEQKTQRLFIADLRGKLYDIAQVTPLVFLDLAEVRPKFIDNPGLGTGFGSFAFHPDFKENGLFYTTHSELPGSGIADFDYEDSIRVTLQWVLTEWQATNPMARAFEGTSREILRIDFLTSLHGMQEIAFNPTVSKGHLDYRKLYVAIGDGGSVENGFPHLSFHNAKRVWSSILRIDPTGRNSRNGQYGIPDDNPYKQDIKNDQVGEIWAHGFRNPNRLTWDREGRMLATDIGARQIEEVNLILPGLFYGWPIREGTFLLDHTGILGKVYALPDNDSIAGVTYPVIQFDHDEGQAITGGYAYYGNEIPELFGKYVFGDISADRLFFSDLEQMKLGKQAPIYEWKISLAGEQTTFKKLCDNCGRIELRLGSDCQDRLYVFTKSNGKIYQLLGLAK